MPPVTDSVSDKVRPYLFHGMDLQPGGVGQLVGDCPLCGKEGRWFVGEATGLWDCKVCGAKGNQLEFVRQLYDACYRDQPTPELERLAADRGQLDPHSLLAWGVCRSVVTGEWLLPGYTHDGRLCQLYAYRRPAGGGKPVLLATAGLGHGLHGVLLFDPDSPEVMICEGPWDGVALWETLRHYKPADPSSKVADPWPAHEPLADYRGQFVPTASEASSLLAGVSVLAVPGCNVWRDEWSALCSGKRVTICYDSDHPRTHPTTGSLIPPAGAAGARRVAESLARCERPPESIHWLAWGPDGYDPGRPSGYDVRDLLTKE